MAMEAWDSNTFEVSVDLLHEAMGNGDTRRALEIATKIRIALANGFEPGERIGDIWDALEASTESAPQGVCTALVYGLYDYARKRDDLASFARLLEHPKSFVLQTHNAVHDLPVDFIEHAARVGIAKDPALRANASMKHLAAFHFANIRSHNQYLHADVAPLIAPLLDDHDGNVRYAAAYFFMQYAAKAPHDLAEWAPQLMRLILDNKRLPQSKETVSQMARRAISSAARVNPQPMVEAARPLLDGPERSSVRRILKQVLPEALVSGV